MSGWLGLRARSERQYRESMPERGFLNTATNAHFRTLDDGKTIFYPRGAFGRRGFIISATEQEMLLRRNIREYRIGISIVCSVASIAFGSFFQRMEFWQHMTWVAGFFAVDWVFARIYFRRFTKRMESADVPNSPVATWRSMGRTMHPLSLILLVIFVAGIAGACLSLFLQQREPILLMFGALMVVGLVPFVIALKSWRVARART